MDFKINTFDDACKALNLDPAKVVPAVDGYPAQHAKALLAMAKLIIVVQALNGDWKPDWNNWDERKWYIWWDMEKTEENPSGFRLNDVDYRYAYSCVGSRLCFRDGETARWAGEQEEIRQLFQDFMVL